MPSTDASAPKDYISTMLGGALSGALARIPCHPIDTVKANLQVFQHSKQGGGPMMNAIRDVYRRQGILGFYRGLDVALVGSIPAAMLYFSSYEASRDFLKDRIPGFKDVPALAHLGAGMVAESVSCVLWVPIDVLKERSQVGTYSNMVQGAREVLRHEGLKGLYRGYAATVGSFGPFSALYFALYEPFKGIAQSVLGRGGEKHKSDEVGFVGGFAASAAAGGIASFITNPLDLAKVRLQVQRGRAAAAGSGSAAAEAATGSGLQFQYRGMVHGMGEIWRAEGARGLFRGAGARVLFHIPMTAVSMALFETCRSAVRTAMGRGRGGAAGRSGPSEGVGSSSKTDDERGDGSRT